MPAWARSASACLTTPAGAPVAAAISTWVAERSPTRASSSAERTA